MAGQPVPKRQKMAADSRSAPGSYEPTGDIPPEIWIPATRAPGENGRSPSFFQLAFGFLALLTFCGFASLLGAAYLFYSSDLLFPGVQVMGADVGLMTRDEAAAFLQDLDVQQALFLVHGDDAWPVSAKELGLTLDVEQTLQLAYTQGRSPESFLQVIGGERNIEPAWSFDPQTARLYLQEFAPQVAFEPIDAQVIIDQGVARSSPAVEGQAMDLERTLSSLAADPGLVLRDGRLLLAVQAIPPARTDVSELVDQAQQLLSAQVLMSGYDPVRNETQQWTITPEMWQAWITLVVETDKEQPFAWVLFEGAAEAFAAAGLPELGADRYLDPETTLPALMSAISAGEGQIRARVYHRPAQHTVQAGETLSSIGHDYGIPYPWIQEANPASEFLAAGDVITIPSPDDLLPFPVVENKRVVISIGQQKVWVYENDQLKWDWLASTGIDTSPTAPGVFQVQTHELNAYAGNWDLWMPHFMGIYRPVPSMSFMNGFHGFPTRNGSNLLWTGNLGQKVTYGCILLSSENAALLYDWAEEGVVVEILP